MQFDDFYATAMAKGAYVGGTLTAMGSGVLATMADGPPPEVAAVGWVGALVGILGIVVRLVQIWADDRKNGRENEIDKVSLRTELARVTASLDFYKGQYKPKSATIMVTQAPALEPSA